MDKYFNLGSYSRSITTSVAEAQTWFNRGLIWCYGFNQEEAARCFEKVIELDPVCAMGYWGIAYAVGPFYNKPWAWYGEQERVRAIATCHQYAMKAADFESTRIPGRAGAYRCPGAKHPAQNQNMKPSSKTGRRITPTQCAVFTANFPTISMLSASAPNR